MLSIEYNQREFKLQREAFSVTYSSHLIDASGSYIRALYKSTLFKFREASNDFCSSSKSIFVNRCTICSPLSVIWILSEHNTPIIACQFQLVVPIWYR